MRGARSLTVRRGSVIRQRSCGRLAVHCIRTHRIDGRDRAHPRDLRACLPPQKSAPSYFSPPCSRLVPGSARRRRAAPSRRRRVLRRELICTARSWRWTPRIQWSESVAANIVGRRDRKPWGSRHRMGRMHPLGRIAGVGGNGEGERSSGYHRKVSRATSERLPAARSISTGPRSGKSFRFQRSGRASLAAFWPIAIRSAHSALWTNCGASKGWAMVW